MTSLSCSGLGRKERRQIFWRRLWRDRFFALMILPVVIYYILFSYYPMYGVLIAFENYMPSKGITGSEWVGLMQFQKFFNSFQFRQVIWNSLRLSLYSLLAGFPFPILLALMINACPSRRFRKTVQMVTYAPYFISTIVLVAILNQFLSNTTGLYANIARAFGATTIPNLQATTSTFDHIYV